MSTDQGQPSEEELRAALEEQLRQLRVEDVLLQTVVTLVNLAGRRLTAEDEKDPEQARLAIESVRALLPQLPQDADLGPIRDALSQLQMLYVRETQGGAPPAAGQPAPGPAPEPGPSAEDEERAKARAKLWTPPGAG